MNPDRHDDMRGPTYTSTTLDHLGLVEKINGSILRDFSQRWVSLVGDEGDLLLDVQSIGHFFC